MNNKTALIIIAIVIAGITFWSGVQFGKNQTSAKTRTSGAQFFGSGINSGNTTGTRNFRGSVGGNFISGEIISKDNQSVTIKLQDGSTKIVFYSGNTVIQKTIAGSNNDLSVNTAVTITGTTNSDGSFSANSIQIRPSDANTYPQSATTKPTQ